MVLDVLFERRPHVIAASELIVYIEQGRLAGLLGATTVTATYYLATKAVGRGAATRHLETLLSLFDVAPVGRAVLAGALGLDFVDYEDAVLHEAARHAGAAGIVTRDPKGFVQSSLPVYSPEELVNAVRTLEEA